MSIRDIINEIKPAMSQASICLRGDLLVQYDDLTAQLEQYDGWEPESLSDADPRRPLREALKALRDEMQAATVKFTFKTIGDKAASDLLSKHPSPKDEEGNEKYAWNPQTYPAALVAACAVDPSMSEAEAGELFDQLNLAQRNDLFGAALRANQREVDIPFSEAVYAQAASTEQN